MKKFKNLITGTIHEVTNEALIPQYEESANFEEVAEKKEEKKPIKKASK